MLEVKNTATVDELDSFIIEGTKYTAVDTMIVMEFPVGFVPKEFIAKLTYHCYLLDHPIDGYLNNHAVRIFSRACLPGVKYYVHPTKVLVRKSRASDYTVEDVDSLKEALNDEQYFDVILLQLHEF